MIMRTQILVRGIVQGVGFRPYIFLLARSRALKGQVSNNAYGVMIELEGEAKSIEGVHHRIILGVLLFKIFVKNDLVTLVLIYLKPAFDIPESYIFHVQSRTCN